MTRENFEKVVTTCFTKWLREVRLKTFLRICESMKSFEIKLSRIQMEYNMRSTWKAKRIIKPTYTPFVFLADTINYGTVKLNFMTYNILQKVYHMILQNKLSQT